MMCCACLRNWTAKIEINPELAKFFRLFLFFRG